MTENRRPLFLQSNQSSMNPIKIVIIKIKYFFFIIFCEIHKSI